MGKESIQSEIQSEQNNVAPLKERVAADHAASSTQLKAEHAKESAQLKAEEAQRTAELKAEHAKTPGKTGLIAKLTGSEDPVKKAENQQLKAEIARAEQTTKAGQAAEKAELNAATKKEDIAYTAANSLHGSGVHSGSGVQYAQPGVQYAQPGVQYSGSGIQPGVQHSGVYGRNDAGLANNQDESLIYNHATGAHGLAALQDNGLHHHHGHGTYRDAAPQGQGLSGPGSYGMAATGGHGIAALHDNGLGDRNHHHGANQGMGVNQGMAAGPIMMAPVMATVPVMTSVPMTSAAPVATMPMNASAPATRVATLAPGNEQRL